MPKHKSKDRSFMTATEWKEFGGHKEKKRKVDGALPFECCALTLLPFETPACTRDGVLFDWVAIVEFVQAHGTSPVTGDKMSLSSIIKLKMAKNDGQWACPVTQKPFSKYSKVAAIATTGNVYAYEALKQTCFKGALLDPLDSTPFDMSDVVVVHDPDDEALKSRRDLRLEQTAADPSVRLDASGTRTLELARQTVAARDALPRKKVDREEDVGLTEPFLRVRALGPRTNEVTEGCEMTDGGTSRSATSTAVNLSTTGRVRAATDAELRVARWQTLRGLKKKGYVRLETSIGSLNVEIHCDAVPRAAENFLGLCAKGYYDNLTFHRVVADFVAQTGDPTGDGTGGSSLWGKPFDDEFDDRYKHDARGVLAYANSGRNQNRSQFYITFKALPNLNKRHTVFGRLVGGFDALDSLERVPVDDKDDNRPMPGHDVIIKSTVVFVDPVPEADARFETRVTDAVNARDKPPVVVRPAPGGGAAAKHSSAATTVGRYLAHKKPPPEPAGRAKNSSLPKKQSGGGSFGNFDGW